MVQASTAPRVIIIRHTLATLLIEEKRHKEAAKVLCEYLKNRPAEHPRQGMKMLTLRYYETERGPECVHIATSALAYNKNPVAIPAGATRQ